MKTCSGESARLNAASSGFTSGSGLVKMRLYPLVRTSIVLRSGLTTVVTAWLAVQFGMSETPGFSETKVAPWGASGVRSWPILGRAGCAWAGMLEMSKASVRLAVLVILVSFGSRLVLLPREFLFQSWTAP